MTKEIKLDGPELWEIVFNVNDGAAGDITDEQFTEIAEAINKVFIDPARPSAPVTPIGGETGPLFVDEPVDDCSHISDDMLWKVLADGKATAEDQRYAAGWIAKLTKKPLPEHDLYKTGDADAPDAIKDRNGAVALDLCRRCNRGEIELSEGCVPEVPETYEYAGFMYEVKRLGGKLRMIPVVGQHEAASKDKHIRAAIECYEKDGPNGCMVSKQS